MEAVLADKIHQYFSTYPRRSYPKGQILIFADESPEHIFYLVSGKVVQYDVSYRGDEIIVNVFKPPAFFPMSWAINHTPNKYFYKTDAATELHIAPVDDALQFLKANPDVMFDLLSRLYKGTDGLLGRIVHLMSGTAKSRLLYELLIESQRFGHRQADGSYLLDISEQDIAARAGLSRETVNREMRKIKTSKLVRFEKGHIVIEDPAALAAALGSDL